MTPAAHSAILSDHILSAILVLAKRENARSSEIQRLAFPCHDFQLQEIFHDLHQTGKYPILASFVFSDTGPEPFSPALNESLSRLQLSGLIGRENPDYEVIFLRTAADSFFDDVLDSEFDPGQKEQLTEIASKFLERVKTV